MKEVIKCERDRVTAGSESKMNITHKDKKIIKILIFGNFSVLQYLII